MARRWQSTVYGRFPHRFRVASLSELCHGHQGIQTGPFGSQLHSKDYVSSGTPIATVEHLGENRIIHHNLPLVSDQDRDRLSKYTLRRGDILFSRVGSVDRRGLVRQAEEGWLFSGRCLRVRPNTTRIDAVYLSYFFGLSAFKEYVRSIAVGATMPSINTQLLGSVPIVYPPLSEQRAIAYVLGTFDNKIDLNRRMCETLEEMARALFKSWFVDFDPVRAKMEGRWRPGESLPGLPAELYNLFPDRLVNSELGPIPQGWGVGALDDVVDILSGGTPRTNVAEYWQGPIPWYTAKDAPSQSKVFVIETERSITSQGIANSATKILPKGTTVITARGSVGKLACLGRPMAMNQTCYGLRGKNGYSDYFTYMNIKMTLDQLLKKTHGTIFDTITRQTFRTINQIIPSLETARAFDIRADPLMDQILNNLFGSRSISALRDTLLPRLVSGQVRL